MGNSRQKQAPANKEKDACKKPQLVSSFRLKQKNWAKIIKWQLKKPHILGASLEHFWSLSTKTHTRHKIFQNPHQSQQLCPQTVEWRSTYHDPHCSGCAVPVTAHSDCGITEWSHHLLFQELQVHVATVLQRGLWAALTWRRTALPPFSWSCSALLEGWKSDSAFSEKPTGLGSCPSSKLYFGIFNGWLFVDFKGVCLMNSGPATGETPSSRKSGRTVFMGTAVEMSSTAWNFLLFEAARLRFVTFQAIEEIVVS